MNLSSDPKAGKPGDKWRATYTEEGWILEYGPRRGARFGIGKAIQAACLYAAQRLNNQGIAPTDGQTVWSIFNDEIEAARERERQLRLSGREC